MIEVANLLYVDIQEGKRLLSPLPKLETATFRTNPIPNPNPNS